MYFERKAYLKKLISAEGILWMWNQWRASSGMRMASCSVGILR